MPSPLGGDSMLTLDELARAREFAASLYQSMLADFDYSSEEAGEQSALAERERILSVVAWRQAVAFEFTSRVIMQNGVSG